MHAFSRSTAALLILAAVPCAASDATTRGEFKQLERSQIMPIKALLGESVTGTGIVRLSEGNFAAEAGQITFSELPVGTTNPTYQPQNYGGGPNSPIVRFQGFFAGQDLGVAAQCPPGAAVSGCVVGMPINPLALAGPSAEIRTDSSNPSSPVLSGTPTFNGPIAVLFSTDQAGVGLEGGFFDTVGSTAISAFARDGSLLGSVSNESTGIEFLGLATADGSEQIAGILFSLVGNESNGFAIDNLRFAVSEDIIDPVPPIPPAPTPQAFSVGNDGRPAQGTSRRASLSGDGSALAFDSTAANLRATLPNGATFNDSNGNPDVFLRLNGSDAAILASVDDNGFPLTLGATKSSVAGSGPTAAAKGGSDVRVAFRGGDGQIRTFFSGLGRSRGASTSAAGTPANAPSDNPEISSDGSSVAFDSAASNLVGGDSNQQDDVFVKRVDSGAIERVSTTASGGNANGPSRNPSLSADGATVFFETQATNIVATSPTASPAKGANWQICGVSNRGLGRNYVCFNANADLLNVKLSSSGEFGVFESDATNLDPTTADTNGVRDVFWFRFDGTRIVQILRVSKNALGQQGNGASRNPTISGDGDQVFFESEATNLVSPDTNGRADNFVKVVSTGQIQRLVTAADGNQGNGASGTPAVSADGRKVAFDSEASNLVAGDTNGLPDVFGVDNPAAAGFINYSFTYWNPTQPGWGLNLQHQGDLVYGTWYTYATDGQVMFLTMETRPQPDGSFGGPVFRVSGIPFSQINNAPAVTTVTQIGTATLRFDGSGGVTFNYTVNGVSQSRQLERFVFDPTPVTCQGTTQSRASATNYSDLWWNSSEPGWGLTLAHQGNIIFVLWYTYGAGGRDQWISGSSLVLQADGSYQGSLQRPLAGIPLTQINGPATSFPVPTAGSASLRFIDGENGIFSYTLDGVTQSKLITRFVVVAADQPKPLCVSAASGGPAGPTVFTNEQDFPIRDGQTVESPIVVTGQAGNAPANLRVRVEIIHTFIGDLTVDIIAPNGATGRLHDETGGGTQNLIMDYIVDASEVPANGTWRLRVTDNFALDEGFIDRWSLSF